MARKTTNTVGWGLLTAAVLAAALVPFFLFGQGIENWTKSFIATAGRHRLVTAAVLGGLLAADIVLPVPSSIVSTAAGLLLGLFAGAVVSFAGMSVSCVAGYALGRWFSRSLGPRLLGAAELEKLRLLGERFGDWVVVVTRPVPVLAEAAVFFAGTGRMKFPRFCLMCAASNLAISLVYAATGSFSSGRLAGGAGIEAFLLAFGGSVCLPGLMMLAFRPFHGRSSDAGPRA